MANHFLPFVGNDSIGQRTVHGTWVPPGSRVAAYVGPQSESTDAYVNSSLLVSTLAAGLARCRAGKGDVVYVLPGHTETVSATTGLANLVTGTQIIGCAPFGSSLMPTFTFAGTTNTSVWSFNKADVSVSGLRINGNGADSIDTPLIVTGAGNSFKNNIFLTGSDTALDTDVMLTVSTGADFCNISGNYFYSTGTAVNTNAVLVSAAVDSLQMLDNVAMVPATSTNGIFAIGAAAVVVTNMNIGRNRIVNKSTGTAGIILTDVAHTGMVYENFVNLTASAASGTNGIGVGVLAAGATNSLVQMFQNFVCDGSTKGTTGVIVGVAAS